MIIDILNSMFTDVDNLYEFIVDNTILHGTIECYKCGGLSKLMKATNNGQKTIIYRCKTTGCQRRQSLTSSKLPITKLTHIIYMLMLDTTYHNIFLFHGIADTTTARIKKNLLKCFNEYMNERRVFLGGQNIIVEVDETVLSRKGIIRNPTSFDDISLSTVWILGAVEKDNPKIFFIKRVENRRIETITACLEGNILIGSKLYSDGYPSYPAVAANLFLNHEIVNHNRGFVTEDGVHTNNIEGFWAHLKSMMRKEHGVKRENIDDWLIQYSFKRRYLIGCTREEFSQIFIEILKIYYKK